MKRYDVVVNRVGPGISQASVDQCEDGGYYCVGEVNLLIAAQQARIAQLEAALRELIRGYVNTLDAGRERILFYFGQCDDVETMERGDPHLIRARAALTPTEA